MGTWGVLMQAANRMLNRRQIETLHEGLTFVINFEVE